MGSAISSATSATVPRLARVLAVLAGALLLLGLAFGAGGDAGAQEDRSVRWLRYDVTIDVQMDGAFLVTERFDVRFDGAPPFTYGFAEIPTGRVEGLTDVTVAEVTGEERGPLTEVELTDFSRTEPDSFTVIPGGTYLRIEYSFPPASNETRAFELTYRADGALRVYRDEDPPNEQVWWVAIDQLVTGIAPIDLATVTVRLPAAAPVDQVVLGEDAEGPPAERTADGRVWTWEQRDMGPGEDFVVRMQFPPMTNAAKPAWQDADDRLRAEEEERAERRLIAAAVALAAGLFALPASGAFLYATYRRRGRDPEVGLVAEFLPAPPDDLPPGLAGMLVDEQATTPEIVATLIDLGNRGVLEMEQISDKSFSIRLLQSGASLSAYERKLIDALFPGAVAVGQTVLLEEARTRISKRSGEITRAMSAELVSRGYFEAPPEKVRGKWTGMGFGMIAGGGVVAFAGAGSDTLGIAAIIAGIVVGIIGIGVMITGQAMPRRTLEGAEGRARWLAFKRYLEEIKRFEQGSELDHDPGIFERYLPFATAFGVDKDWIERYARAGTPAPRWFVPAGHSTWSPGRDPSPGGGGGIGKPDLQGASGSAMASLASTSAGLTAFLNAAATAFTPPSSSGGSGGFSGGGGRGGGGGGGGGGRGFG